jgi:hypothetical protein
MTNSSSGGDEEWYLNGIHMTELEHRRIIFNRFHPVCHFAYEFPGGMDAVIKNRLLGFAGFHL